LVDSAIFLRHQSVGRPDWKPENDKTLELEEGNIHVLCKEDPIEFINDSGGGYVYFWGAATKNEWDKFRRLDSNSFVLVNPMFNGIHHENYMDPDVHHFAIPEGAGFQDCFLRATVPDNIPCAVNHYTSETFLHPYECEKVYDWIWVSTFDPRKSHIDFLRSIVNTPNARNLKGCFVGPKPQVGKKPYPKYEFHKSMENNYHAVRDIVGELDTVDIHLSLKDLDEVKKMMSKSKIFINLSQADNGPRAASEAALCGLPILTMPHIGAADLVIPGITGEIINDRNQAGSALLHMIENYDQYDRHRNVDLLKPENVYPDLIERIKHEQDLRSRAG